VKKTYRKLSGFELETIHYAIRYIAGRRSISASVYPALLLKEVLTGLDEKDSDQIRNMIKEQIDDLQRLYNDNTKNSMLDSWIRLYAYLDKSIRITVVSLDGKEYEAFEDGDNLIPVSVYEENPLVDTTFNPDFIKKS